MENRYYLAALDLRDRPCLVVGAGPVGLEKIEGLLAAGAVVYVVALDAIEEVRALERGGRIELSMKPYEASDLDGCLLVIAATSDTKLNTRIYRDAQARSMLINVVDVPELCSFILPAVVRHGPLALAVSTAGASPALAKRIKREISGKVGEEYALLAEFLNDVRGWAKTTLPTYDDRREFFEGIVNGDPDPIALLRAGDREAVRALIEEAKSRAQARLATK